MVKNKSVHKLLKHDKFTSISFSPKIMLNIIKMLLHLNLLKH